MPRMIDADALIGRIEEEQCKGCYSKGNCPSRCALVDIRKKVHELPTIDAVEVVRCKDCRYGHATETLGETCWHCGLTRHVTTANGYCDKGEKRNAETD